MPLDIFDQLELMRNSLSKADFDLLVRTIKNPDLISPEETKTVAESLGLSNGFVSWAVNIATDPTVWIAAIIARKSPSWIWSSGIPKRFLGSATEFTGISRLTRPVMTYFRGSGVEEMLAMGMHRQSHVNRLMQPVSEALSSLTPDEKIALVRLREEGITSGVSDKVRTVDSILTTKLEDVWNSVASQISDVRGGPAGLGESGTITYGPFRERVQGRLIQAPRAPLAFRNYVPHLPILSTEGTVTLSGVEALTRMAKDGGRRLQQALTADGLPLRTMKVGGEQVVTELGPWKVDLATDTIQSSIADFTQAMRGQTGRMFFGHLETRVRNIPLFSPQGQKAFVLDIDQIFANYTRGMSRTYAWNAPLSEVERSIGAFARENPNPTDRIGRFFIDRVVPQRLTNEPLIIQIQKAALEQMGVKAEAFVVSGTENWHQPVRGYRFRMTNEPLRLQALEHLIQGIRGSFNEDRVLFGNAFSNIAAASERVLGAASPALRSRLAAHFELLKSKGTNRAIQNFLASYSYYTTLGLNASTTLGNALQTPLTTVPAIGVGSTLRGAAEFAGKFPAYARAIAEEFNSIAVERGSKSIRALPEAGRRAWARVFPDLAEFRVEVDPRLFELDAGALQETPGRAGQVFKNADAYMSWTLGPFRAVETANRAIAFYGARHDFFRKFRIDPRLTGIPEELLGASGEITPAAQEFINLHAARTVNATQFLPGGGTRTIAQDLVAPWLRTFSSFPIRFMSHLGESTVKGALMEREMQMASWFERLTGGRNFGPLARLYLTGNIIQKGLRDTLGLDVNNWVGFRPLEPGGEPLLGPVPIPPIAGALVNTARAINDREWDRAQPLELPGIGKMPIPKTLVPAGVAFSRAARAINQFEPDMGGFVDEDNRLVRSGGTTDLILSMLGVPTQKARRERIQLATLRTRMAKIREFRRKFAQAILNADLDEAVRLKAQYGETFKDMPELNVAEDDLRTYAEYARVPRLARALRSIGDQRPILESQLIDIDPDLLAVPEPSLAGVLPTGE